MKTAIVAASIFLAATAHAFTSQDLVGTYRLKGYTLTYGLKTITEKDTPANGEFAFTGDRYLHRFEVAGQANFAGGTYSVSGTTITLRDENNGGVSGTAKISIVGDTLKVTASYYGMIETDVWQRVAQPRQECPPCQNNMPPIEFRTCDMDGDPAMTIADAITIMQVNAGLRPEINPVGKGGSFSAQAQCVDGAVVGVFASAPCFP